jgi:hypothetical protein
MVLMDSKLESLAPSVNAPYNALYTLGFFCNLGVSGTKRDIQIGSLGL